MPKSDCGNLSGNPWDNRTRMKEKNRQTLIDALRHLPVHRAPAVLWEEIEQELAAEKLLQAGMNRLPQYNAPANAWAGIESQLDIPTPARTKIRRLRPVVLRVAAAILIGLVAWQGWQQLAQRPSVTYLKGEEIQTFAFARDWDADEADFAEVTALFTAYCERERNPRDCQLQEDLAELNAARRELTQAVDTYGADPQLIKQLSKIELDRSAIVRQMAQRI